VNLLRNGAIGCCVVALGTTIVACSKSSSSASPSPTSPSTVAIIITSSGANPKTLTVKPGSQVTFINNDSVDHQMYSDPHPEHTDCPEFDSVGFLGPGQTRQTGNLNVVRTCGFHDHIHFENTSLRGSITIQ
jgi:plastocyanin